jgi:hypothetical protein
MRGRCLEDGNGERKKFVVLGQMSSGGQDEKSIASLEMTASEFQRISEEFKRK